MGAVTALPPWHQSRIKQYLRCPRSYRLAHVDRIPRDHNASGYAAISGTALHQVIADRLTAGKPLADLGGRLYEAFATALHEAQEKGDVTDPDRVPAALEKLEGPQLRQLAAFNEDARLDSVDWFGVERKFGWRDRSGREFRGTIDAIGRSRTWVPGFAGDGNDLQRGDVLVVDWKTGEVDKSWVARRTNVQLAFYTMAIDRSKILQPGRRRLFIGALQDLEPYKRPPGIPAKLRRINPEFLAATGLGEEDAKASKKRPRGVSKWIEEDNPEFLEATKRPRGPFFHECRVDWDLTVEAIRSAVRGAEAGLFPATGAITGGCGLCSFRTVCVNQEV